MLTIKSYILLIIINLYSISIFSQTNDFYSDSIRAREINRKANILGLNGMNIQALDTFLCGLELRKKLYGNENYNLGAVYLGIGITYSKLGQFDLALQNLNLAEKNYQLSSRYSINNRTRLYSNIGNVYRSKLDFKRALDYFYQTLLIYENNQNSNLSEIASINYKIAEIYYLLNDYPKALELINNNISNAYLEDQILYYELLAFINQIEGDHIKAKANYLNQISLTEQKGGIMPIEIAIIYLNYASFLNTTNNVEEAASILSSAFSLIKKNQPKHGEVLAEYYRIQGYISTSLSIETEDIISFKAQKKQNLYKSIEWFKKGLSALRFPEQYSFKKINNSNELLSVMSATELLKLIGDNYKEIANIEQNKESSTYILSLNNALEHYKIAGDLIQKARLEISSDESKIQLTELEYATFQNLIQTAFDAYNASHKLEFIELAFQSAERVKSSSVFDNLSKANALENSLIPDSLLQLEKKLNTTISIFSEELFEANSELNPNISLINEYDSIIFTALRDREELNQYLESEFSDYYDLKYSASLLSIFEIQQKLTNDEIILEYVLNEKESLTELYTFIISNDKVDFMKQDVGLDFLNSIETMFHFMSSREYMLTTNNESKAYCVAANQLFEILILPFYEEIKSKKLTIVPDGKLSYIAFDGLLENLPDTSKTIQFNKLNYLIKNFNINYSNSSNLLFKTNNSSKKTKNKAIAFAPIYNSDTFEIANQKIILVPIQGVQQEVKQIEQTINTKIYANADATESNFRENIKGYDILHLAMHAYINDSLPAFSSLAFTIDSAKTNIADGWLNTADIYNLELDAKLTVLSACNTGTGQLKKGEGIMSLARGFFYAGCPSIIMSLWEVEDQSGTEIMGAFYKNLKRGKTKDGALRLAKLEYLKNANSRRAHPHYWLGYVSIGDNSPLYKSYDFYFFSLLILILIGISIDQTFRIKKARKKRAS